jgi:hypothetical protein
MVVASLKISLNFSIMNLPVLSSYRLAFFLYFKSFLNIGYHSVLENTAF